MRLYENSSVNIIVSRAEPRGMMLTVSSPPESKAALMLSAALFPRFSIATTEATPIMIPRSDRNVRSLLPAIEDRAILIFSPSIICDSPIVYRDDPPAF